MEKLVISIVLGLGLAGIDFFVAIFIIKKAIKKEWNTFYRFLTVSILTRLFFVLVNVAIAVIYLDIDKVGFLLALFAGIIVLKAVEVLILAKGRKTLELKDNKLNKG